MSSYDGMKARTAQIPAPSKYRVTEAGDRVVQFYEAWGKPEKLREWRQKLASAAAPQARIKP